MSRDVQAEIAEIVRNNQVVLFMKGTPELPMCGFSAKTVRLLERAGARYLAVNVLADPEMREGVKAFAAWPTLPQLYIDGSFVGGCDVTAELFETGELAQLLGKAA